MDKRIPLLSGKAGNDGAGGIEGGFKQTLFSGVFSTTMMASTFKAWLFDAGANSRTDITSQATSEVINSFAPFGQTPKKGNCEKNIQRVNLGISRLVPNHLRKTES